MITNNPETTTKDVKVAMITKLLTKLRLKPTTSPCCQARIIYRAGGYRKDECSQCHAVLKRYDY